MHVVFGVYRTASLLLGSTVWMLAADHQREWKRHTNGTNRSDRQRDLGRLANGRLTRIPTGRNARNCSKELLQHLSVAPSQALVEQFKDEVRADAERQPFASPSLQRD